jgi:hypothetical protein
MIQLESFFPGQSQDTPRGSHNNVRTVVLEQIPVSLDRYASIEHSSFYFRKILGEPFVLMCDLERQLTGMAQYQDAHLILASRKSTWVQLVERSQDKHGRFTHSGLGLADDVHTKNSLRDALVLDFGGVLKTAVNNSTKAFRLEDEVFETRGVDSYIVAPDFINERSAKIKKIDLVRLCITQNVLI